VVVLGCQPVRGGRAGELTGALGRRLWAAREAFAAIAGDGLLIASGGRTWRGVVEADAMREALVQSGVRAQAVIRERCSLTTADNARLTAQLLRRFGRPSVVTLVTCDWHMPRAAALFAREGLSVHPAPVLGPQRATAIRWVRAGREWVSGLRVPSWRGA
jgi:uncharacterized SAM-binding protein YcdF (DUF218 family)